MFVDKRAVKKGGGECGQLIINSLSITTLYMPRVALRACYGCLYTFPDGRQLHGHSTLSSDRWREQLRETRSRRRRRYRHTYSSSIAISSCMNIDKNGARNDNPLSSPCSISEDNDLHILLAESEAAISVSALTPQTSSTTSCDSVMQRAWRQ